MKDKEIIKALEFCANEHLGCEDGCPYLPTKCGTDMLKDTLDLINRQKAEIERLQNEIGSLNKAYPCIVKMNDYCLVYARSLEDYDKLIGDISAEAIKEFAERLKRQCALVIGGEEYWEMLKEISNIRDEMVGDAE